MAFKQVLFFKLSILLFFKMLLILANFAYPERFRSIEMFLREHFKI